MKANLVLTLGLAAAALLLSACANTGNRHDPVHAARNSAEVDHQKVALIERAARRKGVQVVWINPPEERRKD